ncbi:MAG: SUMF1/EgtB/PvdO family nonheme iron enzyme [Treponema sp.]|jgi:formylglycine-generating enzyme required for sulfatase activity|nr:SUMF1/EgtB/PvdO family nonheme iron enzyme [Treponema sp.]
MFNKKKEILPEDEVHLKSILGLKPGVYLSVFYVFIFLMICFCALVAPGLAKPGTMFALESEPAGAAVRVDNVYLGTTPCDVFVPQGAHQLTMTLPGFAPREWSVMAERRVFASAFFPRKECVVETLTETADTAALLQGASEYAAWSFTGEPTAIYQIPRSLSEGVYRSGTIAATPRGYEAINDLLRGAARFTTTRAAARDMVRAKAMADNAGLAPSPLSLLSSIEDALAYLSETPGSAAWLAALLPKEANEVISRSSWYAKLSQEQPASRFPTGFGETFVIEAMAFRELSSATLAQGEAFPHEIEVNSFLIAANEVSREAWDTFLAAEPRWRSDNLTALKAEELASEDYLLSLNAGSSTIPSVSWHAANAFCAWLTTLLPPALNGYEVRLPTEAEWEYAAKMAEQYDGVLHDISGGLWEWCADPYAPLNFLPAKAAIIEAIASPERVVRGGSRANQPDTFDVETRGSLPPEFCSPFVSFRPIIAIKSE